jgi:hypothetical protein
MVKYKGSTLTLASMTNASPTGSAHSNEVFTCSSEQLLTFHAEELSLSESEALTGGSATGLGPVNTIRPLVILRERIERRVVAIAGDNKNRILILISQFYNPQEL